MPYVRKTWREKRDLDKAPKRVRLDADFGGIRTGQTMLVATPRLVDAYLRRIPRGETRTIERLRRELARRHRCDATCPVSLAFFLRICAEAAWEEHEAGATPDAITPFWRVIEPGSKIANRLRADSQFIARQRELEMEAPRAVARRRSRPAVAAGTSKHPRVKRASA